MNKQPTTTDELFKLVLSILPDAEIDMDLDGQIIVYTGLTLEDMTSNEERLVPFVADEN